MLDNHCPIHTDEWCDLNTCVWLVLTVYCDTCTAIINNNCYHHDNTQHHITTDWHMPSKIHHIQYNCNQTTTSNPNATTQWCCVTTLNSCVTSWQNKRLLQTIKSVAYNTHMHLRHTHTPHRETSQHHTHQTMYVCGHDTMHKPCVWIKHRIDTHELVTHLSTRFHIFSTQYINMCDVCDIMHHAMYANISRTYTVVWCVYGTDKLCVLMCDTHV